MSFVISQKVMTLLVKERYPLIVLRYRTAALYSAEPRAGESAKHGIGSPLRVTATPVIEAWWSLPGQVLFVQIQSRRDPFCLSPLPSRTLYATAVDRRPVIIRETVAHVR